MSAMAIGIILTRWVINRICTELGTALKLRMCQINPTAMKNEYKIGRR